MRAQSAARMNPLARKLAERIATRGPIPFSEYMEVCLYDAEHGYYSHPERTGFADYYTSVDVHPIFGRLIARQLVEMWRLMERPASFWVVESGAGVGRLAAHILDFVAARLPEFYDALRYAAVERSAARRAAHARMLAPHVTVGRVDSRAGLPATIPAGCLLSNEMFDALPLHRVVCQRGNLREIYAGLRGDKFADVTGELSDPRIAEYFDRQCIALREGQQAEAGIAACDWIADAGRRLEKGFVLAVDYGYEAGELYSERRMRGTLLAYRNHRVSEDFYAEPGEQDLTAHANFTAITRWGGDASLIRVGLVPQSRFLLALGRENQFADLYDDGQSETERIRAQMQLSSLIHPEGMGETFQVLVLRKGVADVPLTGLMPV
jgi:SAM-dependent MidA family methyltransferase